MKDRQDPKVIELEPMSLAFEEMANDFLRALGEEGQMRLVEDIWKTYPTVLIQTAEDIGLVGTADRLRALLASEKRA